MPRTLIIGDVHGCREELQALLALAEPERVLLCGDLFTRGPDARGVWELITEWGAQAVLGNHDARMLEIWDKALAGEGRGVTHRAVRALRGSQGVRAWLEALPLSIAEPSWLLVHAGVNPEEGLLGTSRKRLLTLRRWPDDARPSNPRWWALWSERFRPGLDPLVIHGHDAILGLRDHRPFSLGLDGGCVFGGTLCGYLVEEDRLLTWPARRVWCEPGGRGTKEP
jgi:hypothetical protein